MESNIRDYLVFFFINCFHVYFFLFVIFFLVVVKLFLLNLEFEKFCKIKLEKPGILNKNNLKTWENIEF